jgi:Protein of unknown function (DUF4239)
MAILALPVWIASALVVSSSVAVAILGLVLFRRYVKLDWLEGHNDVAGFIYAQLGVVYAVLMAFIVIVIWQRFDAADQTAAQEAAILIALYRDTAVYPDPEREHLRTLIRTYTVTVAEDEWETMRRGQASLKARKALAALWQGYLGQPPQTIAAATQYSEASRRLNDMSTKRTVRILTSSSGLPFVLWFVLVGGGVVVVGFTYLFGMRSLSAHAAMTGVLAGLTASVLLVTFLLDHPFAGEVRVTSESFDHALAVFDNRDAE